MVIEIAKLSLDASGERHHINAKHVPKEACYFQDAAPVETDASPNSKPVFVPHVATFFEFLV